MVRAVKRLSATAAIAHISSAGCGLRPQTDDDHAADTDDVCCASRRIFEYYAS